MNAERSRSLETLFTAARSHLASLSPIIDNQGSNDLYHISQFISGFTQATTRPNQDIPNSFSDSFVAGFKHARSLALDPAMPSVLHELFRDHLPNIYCVAPDSQECIRNLKLSLSNFHYIPFHYSTRTFPVSILPRISSDFQKRFPRFTLTFHLSTDSTCALSLLFRIDPL